MMLEASFQGYLRYVVYPRPWLSELLRGWDHSKPEDTNHYRSVEVLGFVSKEPIPLGIRDDTPATRFIFHVTTFPRISPEGSDQQNDASDLEETGVIKSEIEIWSI
jgi:hypothetical protein